MPPAAASAQQTMLEASRIKQHPGLQTATCRVKVKVPGKFRCHSRSPLCRTRTMRERQWNSVSGTSSSGTLRPGALLRPRYPICLYVRLRHPGAEEQRVEPGPRHSTWSAPVRTWSAPPHLVRYWSVSDMCSLCTAVWCLYSETVQSFSVSARPHDAIEFETCPFLFDDVSARFTLQ